VVSSDSTTDEEAIYCVMYNGGIYWRFANYMDPVPLDSTFFLRLINLLTTYDTDTRATEGSQIQTSSDLITRHPAALKKYVRPPIGETSSGLHAKKYR